MAGRKTRSPSPPAARGRSVSRTRPVSFHSGTRSLSRSKSRGAKATSRASSRSSSSSPTRRNTAQNRGRQHDTNKNRPGHSHGSHSQEHHHHGLFKTSASLLAGIGLATVLAHKVWPKGILYGDSEDWESRPHPKHRHSDRHLDRPRPRRSLEAERVIERARRHGDVIYYEEIGPLPSRRRPVAHQNYDRLSRSVEDERMRRPFREEPPRAGRLPYPNAPYPGETYYEPERRRTTVAQPVTMPR
ncbi:hypothetical protein FDECE_15850 [Fusarium decemcellulare]|nr:hypothetical protein FDECE_15850 [Fusarium decemcellulare]